MSRFSLKCAGGTYICGSRSLSDLVVRTVNNMFQSGIDHKIPNEFLSNKLFDLVYLHVGLVPSMFV